MYGYYDSSSSEDDECSRSSGSGEDYDDSLCHFATGYVGVVTRFIESSVAELRFSVSGCMQYAALDRCRLYINGCLCSNRKSIQRYISVGDTVNFDAAKAHPGFGINFRIVTGWVGKMPKGERLITSKSVPTHRIRFPHNFNCTR